MISFKDFMGDACKCTFNVRCRQGYAHINLLSHLSGWVVKGCRSDTSIHPSILWILRKNLLVGVYPAFMNSTEELAQLHKRLRSIRESKGLTLNQVAARSKGTISAIALGSYERGDRSISAKKLLRLAQIYQIPAFEFFSQPQSTMERGRVVIDYRKLRDDSDPSVDQFRAIIAAIAAVRRDWNGEVISLRAGDINSLQIFASMSVSQTNEMLDRYALTRWR